MTAIFSRREALRAGALGAAVLALPGAALARGPKVGTPAPYFYRTKLGDAEVTIVSDGVLPLGDPHKNFLGLSTEEMDRQLTDSFLPTGNAMLEQNIMVLNTGDRMIVFDTGMGASKLFGPTTGRMMANLKQAGIDPANIDAVVMSHAHIDHCGGCMTADGQRNFPNAQYYISQADFDYWTADNILSGALKDFGVQARNNLVPNRDRLIFFKDGQEFLPGVTALSAPGHTVGHTIFMVSSGKDTLCYIGDLTHHPVLLLQKPLTEFAYDTDPKQSAQTRLKMLTMLADNKTQILAYHFAWPGIGHVAKAGEGFRYYPANMTMDPG